MTDHEKIREYIALHKEEMIGTLKRLIASPSPDKGDTEAQEVVREKLEELGFETEEFRMDERVKDLKDYCDPGFVHSEGAYNVVGTRKGKDPGRTLMLYGHIDTESEDYFGIFEDPYEAKVEDGKIYGLGASDDKGGIAMILEALRTALAIQGDLDQDLIVLSLLGKHGGAFGTLSAMVKGYAGDDSIYLHPAETGHGFQEIKNISLGTLDLKLTVFGENGILHDDLSPGLNANILMAEAIVILEDFNRKKREERVFDFGSFRGQPAYILNIGSLRSGYDHASVCEKAECLMRCRFFFPETIDSVFEEIEDLLKKQFRGKWLLEKGNMRAQPAMVGNDDPFVRFIERSIETAEGKQEFIHQYHGGSDIRFPILYGNSRCVGIGPYCQLPKKGEGKMEWIDIDDYLKGIEILSIILTEYGKERSLREEA